MPPNIGRLNPGIEYQFKVITYTAVCLCENKDVEDFLIYTNREEIPGFDDIIAKVWYKSQPNPFVYLGQIKHRADKVNLNNKANNINKYRDDMKDIFEKRTTNPFLKELLGNVPKENVEFWFFCSKSILNTKNNPIVVDGIEYVVKPNNTYKPIFTFRKGAACYKLTPDDATNDSGDFDMFHLLLDQPDNKKINEQIQNCDEEMFTKETITQIIAYTTEYLQTPLGSRGLRRYIFEVQLLRLTLSLVTVPPTEAFDIYDDLACLWNKLNLKYDVTIVDHGAVDMKPYLFGTLFKVLKNIMNFTEFNWNMCINNSNKLPESFNFGKFKDITKRDKTYHWLSKPDVLDILLVELWKCDYMPLILSSDCNISTLRKYQHLRKKFIVLDNDYRLSNEMRSSELSVCASMGDIKNDSLERELFEGIDISLQGRETVKFVNVVDNHKNIMSEIRCSHLLTLLKRNSKIFIKKQCLEYGNSLVFIISNDLVSNKEGNDDWRSSLAVSIKSTFQEENVIINCISFDVEKHIRQVKNHPILKNFSTYHLRRHYPSMRLEYLKGDILKIKHFLVDEGGNEMHFVDGKLTPIIGTRLWNEEDQYIPRRLRQATIQNSFLNIEEERIIILTGEVDSLEASIKKKIIEEFSGDIEIQVEKCIKEKRSALLVVENESFDQYWSIFSCNQYPIFHIQVDNGVLKMLKYRNYQNLYPYIAYEGRTFEETTFFEETSGGVNIITGEAGLGKTALLHSLFEKYDKHNFVLFCDLLNYTNELKEGRRSEFFKKPLKYILSRCEYSLPSNSSLSNEFFNSLCEFHHKTNRLLLMIDSFDEAVRLHRKEVLDLLRGVIKCNIQIIISCRPIVEGLLINNFEVRPFQLQHLDKHSAARYLKSRKLPDPDINRIPDEFLVNPMYLKFQITLSKDIFLFSNSSNKFNLYKAVLESQIERYYDRRRDACNSTYQREDVLEVYKLLALVLIFGEKVIQDLGFNYNDVVEKCVGTYRIDLGIIIRFNKDGYPIFMHRKFAEFLVALWIYENVNTISAQAIYQKLLDSDMQDIRLLLDKYVCENLKLHQAILSEDLQLVERLCEVNKECLQDVDECDRTPLHLAASYCRQQTCISDISIQKAHESRGIVNFKILDIIFRHMMKEKFDLNRRDLLMKWTWFEYIRKNNFFFEIACLYGLSATLDKYLDLEKRTIKESDIDNALSKDYLHLALVLLKYNPLLNKKYFDKILEISLKSCDLNSILASIELQNYKNEPFKIFRKICENINPSSNIRDYVNFRVNGEITALHLACMYGNFEIVKRLLNAKVGSCKMDKYKNTPLHYGAMQGSSDIVSMLIRHMPDRPTIGVKYLTLKTPSSVRKKENMNIENSVGMTPLHVASVRGYSNVVNILLQNGANMDSYDKKGNTSLHFATLYKHMSIVELLLENGANIKSKNIDNNTVMHHAAQMGRLDIVNLLLAKDMDVDIKNSNGNTALHNAVIYEQMNIVKLLIENGANTNIQNNSCNTALHSAVIAGRTEIVKVLLRNGVDVNLKGHKCRTPLHMAAYNGHTDIFRFLLNNCSDVNVRDSYDDTPLHCAVQTGNTGIVQMLLQRQTNIDSRGRNGDTPLHKAVNFGHTEILQILLENGADVNIRNAADHTVLDLASIKEKTDILRILSRTTTDKIKLNDHNGATPSTNAIYYEKREDEHLDSRNKTDLMLKYPSDDTGSEEPVEISKVEILETLPKGDVGINVKDQCGKNVPQSTVNLAEVDILETSIENEMDISNINTLHEAATKGNIDMIKLFVTRGFDVNLRGPNGNTALCMAAYSGHEKILEILLENDADFTIRNDDNDTALHLSIQNGNIDIVRVLLAKGIDVNSKGFNGNTSLCLAARHGQAETLEVLLQNGGDYNITNDSNDAPLHLAARGGKTEVVEVLLKNGMNVNLKGPGGNTALHLAADTGRTNTLKILLENGADFNIRNNYNNTALHLAAQNGKRDIVEILLEMGMNINLKGCNGNTALCWAACKGQTGTLGILLENGADCSIRNDDDATVLHLASLNGKRDIIKALLKQGIDINLQDSNGNTSLCLAAWKGEADTLRTLLENGADLNIRNKDGDTVLHIAAQYGRMDIIKVLLRKGVDINLAGSDGNTCLIMAACNEQVETLKALLQNGADINAINGRHNTALHLSLLYEKTHIIEILLKMGVDINLKDAEGNTSLCLAACNGQVKNLEKLLQCGADISIRNDKNDTALHLAAQSGHTEIIEILLREEDDVNSRGFNGNTPLCWAASEGQTEAMETLLLNGADINIKNDDNNTSLHLASCNGKTHIMEVLLRKGVDVNLRGYNGNTSLCLAAYNGQKDALVTLLRNGADTNMKNDNNNTALRLASQYRKNEIIEILIRNGLGANARNTESDTASNTNANNDHQEISTTLLEEGADVGNQNNGSDTPLHLAAQYGKTDVVKVLLKLGSDINLKGGDGNTSLCWSACKGQTETFKTLLESGSDINIRNNYNNTVLHLAALNGKTDIVEILMNTGLDIDSRGYNGNTSLSLAAYSGQTETLVLLLLNGADIGIRNDDNDTALHLAAQYGKADIVKVLLRNGTDVNLRGAHGDTALCVAACNGQPEIVRMLLQSGADPNIKNNAKDDALTLAIKYGKTEVVEVLLNKN